MDRAPGANRLAMVQTVQERSDKGRQQFLKQVERIRTASTNLKGHKPSRQALEVFSDQICQEYRKVFGRIGHHPLLHIKGGKQKPRYLLDRDEVWVVYKPALWEMGDSSRASQIVGQIIMSANGLDDAQNRLLDQDKAGNLYQWHCLTVGNNYLDKDQEPQMTSMGFIQRLDVETDGPVVCAKTWRSHQALKVQMKEHIFNKGYMCLVHGKMENRTQHVRTKFVEIGSEANTTVMLKHDAENDPLWHYNTQRGARVAETFVKPLAYYRKDKSDFTLVYANILSGITHQVRITMQSLGHPLVGDDRYLPKEEAMSDLNWCPRNFLTEVRSDWFDVFGPYKDKGRRKYTRISMENPLPKLLQNVLESRLTLVEKLDPSADLLVGPQYWAIGDEQLMQAYPKDSSFRRKVMRWGQRRGIHLDALDRLLLLPKEDINELLNSYQPPLDSGEVSWLCPKCGAYNNPILQGRGEVQCYGPHSGMECEGLRITGFDKAQDLPKGWTNWLEDPTMHFLMWVNPRWLEARRKVIKQERPVWEKPPDEPKGTVLTPDMLVGLEAALVNETRKGKLGIREEDIPSLGGFEDVKLPLEEPPESSTVRRVRLPGSGTMSQWVYVLKGKERFKHIEQFQVKGKLHLLKPVEVVTGQLPAKQVESLEQKMAREREISKMAKQAEQERRKEKERAEQKIKDMDKQKEQQKEKQESQAARMADISSEPPAVEKPRAPPPEQVEQPRAGLKATRVPSARDTSNASEKPGLWQYLESHSHPGKFYFFNADTGESRLDKPPGFKEWEKKASKSTPGAFYYYNLITGESRLEAPPELQSAAPAPQAAARAPPEKEKTPNAAWQRKESKHAPGTFYYFDAQTGACEMDPPEVDPPWELLESRANAGQYYYYNKETKRSSVDPPPTARPSKKKRKRPIEASAAGEGSAKKAALANGEGSKPTAPELWVKQQSQSQAGKFYWLNVETQETRWTKPPEVP